MGSQLVAVRTGLMAALAEATGFENVECSYAYKKGRKDPRESAWTNNGRVTHTPASLRPSKTFRNEVGTFDVVILVRGIGDAQETTSARALALGVIVEDFIATHVNWANEAIDAEIDTLTVEGDAVLAEAFNDHGTLAEWSIPVRYLARLT